MAATVDKTGTAGIARYFHEPKDEQVVRNDHVAGRKAEPVRVTLADSSGKPTGTFESIAWKRLLDGRSRGQVGP